MRIIILGIILFFLSAANITLFADEVKDAADPQSTDQRNSIDQAGAAIFAGQCAACHPNGENRFFPNLPVIGAPQLQDFSAFLTFLRHPTMPNGAMGPMPPFPETRLSKQQAEKLYRFVSSGLQSSGELSNAPQEAPRGYGYGMGPGMMGRGGYGMGQGMMGGGGYGMGPGMMGRGYGMGPGYGGPPHGDFGYGSPDYRQQLSKPLGESEAKKLLQDYLDNTRNSNLTLGPITDKGTYFEAQIVTRNGSLVDKIIVNKKTGVMHSAY